MGRLSLREGGGGRGVAFEGIVVVLLRSCLALSIRDVVITDH